METNAAGGCFTFLDQFVYLWFSTLYTTLPHNSIKYKLIDHIERTFNREGSLTLHVTTFFTSEKLKKYHAWSCQNVCDALTFFLYNIFIWFGTKLYRQVVGIPMDTNCAPLVADLFLFCLRGTLWCLFLMISRLILLMLLTSWYLDDIFNINTVYFVILTLW